MKFPVKVKPEQWDMMEAIIRNTNAKSKDKAKL